MRLADLLFYSVLVLLTFEEAWNQLIDNVLQRLVRPSERARERDINPRRVRESERERH